MSSTRVYKDGDNHYFTFSNLSSGTYRYLVENDRPHDAWVRADLSTDKDIAALWGHPGK